MAQQQDLSLEIYFKEIQKFSLLSAEEEQRLIVAYKNGDSKAREELVQSNLRLVVNIAKKYLKCGIPLADLIAEGNVGLLYAVDRFEPRHGCRFSTYATFWIKHTICHAITEKNSLIRLPAYMKKIISEYKKQSEMFFQKLGKVPLIAEVVGSLGLSHSQEKIAQTAAITTHALEFAQSLDSEEGIDCISESNAIPKFLQESEVEWLMKELQSTDSKRAEIIKMRYGLNGSPTMTLEEIAEKLKLTKERIRQIEKDTLKLLREYLDKKDMLEFGRQRYMRYEN